MRVVSACSSVDFIRVFVGDGVVRAPACWRDANGWICDHRRADEASPDTQALAAMSKRIGLSRRAPTPRAARAAASALLATLLACAAVGEPRGSDAADAVALSGCLIDADLRVAAIQQMARGGSREEVIATARAALAAAPLEQRMRVERIVDEVYRERPQAQRPYVGARLRECVAAVGARMRAERADDCYQVSRFARDFFAARHAGLSLEQTQQSIRALGQQQGMPPAFAERLGKLAASVYASNDDAPRFRAGLFFHCVVAPPR
jgi:hypothetical protein